MLPYIEATQRKLEKEQKPYNNLTKNERTSMKELCEREDVVIKKNRQRWCRSHCGCKRPYKRS